MNDRTGHFGGELRELLAAVLEALDIPQPATVGDTEAHRETLADRAMNAVVALQGVIARGDNPAWSAAYLRARLAEKPAITYRAWGDAGWPARDQEQEADGQDDAERARRSVDAQFPAVARFLAEERASEAPGGPGGEQAAKVARWNAAHPVGTPVTAYPGVRGGRALKTRTRSEAWVLGGHTPVVLVDDYAGGIALDHVDVDRLPADVRAIVDETSRQLMTADDPLAAAHDFVRHFEDHLAQRGSSAGRGGEDR